MHKNCLVVSPLLLKAKMMTIGGKDFTVFHLQLFASYKRLNSAV